MGLEIWNGFGNQWEIFIFSGDICNNLHHGARCLGVWPPEGRSLSPSTVTTGFWRISAQINFSTEVWVPPVNFGRFKQWPHKLEGGTLNVTNFDVIHERGRASVYYEEKCLVCCKTWKALKIYEEVSVSRIVSCPTISHQGEDLAPPTAYKELTLRGKDKCSFSWKLTFETHYGRLKLYHSISL